MTRSSRALLVVSLSVALAALSSCKRSAPPAGGERDAAPSSNAASAVSASAGPNSCGPLGCQLFDSPEDALRVAIASDPLIVAVGEAHAQKGTEGIDSSAKRFTALLPLFKGTASDLLLELMMPATGCNAKAAAAREAQKPATESHADTDQGEYVAMGNAARAGGIIPDLLRPSCDDLGAIGEAGADGVELTLETIKRLTVAQVKALLGRKERSPGATILLYGGALHNDPAPAPEVADWSYGPEVEAMVSKRYVAIDLFVPEYITNDATWKKWDWYPYYDRASHPEKTTMFHPRPDEYVIIFPVTKR